jgi:hypothetical protein
VRNLRGRDEVEVRAVARDGADTAGVDVALAGGEELAVTVHRAPEGLPRPTSCAGDKIADPLIGRVVAGL